MNLNDYSLQSLVNLPAKQLLIFNCKLCNGEYKLKVSYVRSCLRGTSDKSYFCSRNCSKKAKNVLKIEKECNHCKSLFLSRAAENRKYCSQSCFGVYNNKHKTHGCRRSKLEAWLETKLLTLYPNLEIHFNRKDAINSELDIYIPSLRLAFELNGIYHYEPIHGLDLLCKTQNNDFRKFQACLERNIELCIIDSSSQKKFTEKTSLIFLNVINEVIHKKWSTRSDLN